MTVSKTAAAAVRSIPKIEEKDKDNSIKKGRMTILTKIKITVDSILSFDGSVADNNDGGGGDDDDDNNNNCSSSTVVSL